MLYPLWYSLPVVCSSIKVAQGLGKYVLPAVISIFIVEMGPEFITSTLIFMLLTYIVLVWYGALVVFVLLFFALLVVYELIYIGAALTICAYALLAAAMVYF